MCGVGMLSGPEPKGLKRVKQRDVPERPAPCSRSWNSGLRPSEVHTTLPCSRWGMVRSSSRAETSGKQRSKRAPATDVTPKLRQRSEARRTVGGCRPPQPPIVFRMNHAPEHPFRGASVFVATRLAELQYPGEIALQRHVQPTVLARAQGLPQNAPTTSPTPAMFHLTGKGSLTD